MPKFGARIKPEGRQQERKLTCYADAQDERAIVALLDRLPKSLDGRDPSVSAIYRKALRTFVQYDHPDLYERLYARDDRTAATRRPKP